MATIAAANLDLTKVKRMEKNGKTFTSYLKPNENNPLMPLLLSPPFLLLTLEQNGSIRPSTTMEKRESRRKKAADHSTLQIDGQGRSPHRLDGGRGRRSGEEGGGAGLGKRRIGCAGWSGWKRKERHLRNLLEHHPMVQILSTHPHSK